MPAAVACVEAHRRGRPRHRSRARSTGRSSPPPHPTSRPAGTAYPATVAISSHRACQHSSGLFFRGHAASTTKPAFNTLLLCPTVSLTWRWNTYRPGRVMVTRDCTAPLVFPATDSGGTAIVIVPESTVGGRWYGRIQDSGSGLTVQCATARATSPSTSSNWNCTVVGHPAITRSGTSLEIRDPGNPWLERALLKHRAARGQTDHQCANPHAAPRPSIDHRIPSPRHFSDPALPRAPPTARRARPRRSCRRRRSSRARP